MGRENRPREGADGARGTDGQGQGATMRERGGGKSKQHNTHQTNSHQSQNGSSTRNTTTHPTRKRHTRSKKVHLGPVFERANRGRLFQFP